MEFKQAVITDRGRALMTKLLAGKITQFTKIAVSETKYNDNQLASLTALSNIKSESPVSVSATNATNILATGGVNNVGLQVGYYVNTVGLYANDPDLGEILYSVVSAVDGKNSYIPPDTGVSQSGVTFKIQTEVAKTDNVNMSVDPANIATQGDLDRMKKPFQAWANSVDGKTDFTKVKPRENVFKGLQYVFWSVGAAYGDTAPVAYSYANGVTRVYRTNPTSAPDIINLYNNIKELNLTQPLKNKKIGLSLKARVSHNCDGNIFSGLLTNGVFTLSKDHGKKVSMTTQFNSYTSFLDMSNLALIDGTSVLRFLVNPTMPSSANASNFWVEYKDFQIVILDDNATSYDGYMYTPAKIEDRTRAFPQYTGFSNKDSNDYRDYNWVRSDEAQAVNYEAWASDKNGTNFTQYYPKPNLLQFSKTLAKGAYVNTNSTTGTKDDYATLTNTSQSGTAQNVLFQYSTSPLKADTWYTFSFDSWGTDFTFYAYNKASVEKYDSQGGYSTSDDANTKFKLTSDQKRYWVRFKTPTTTDGTGLVGAKYIMIRVNQDQTGGTVTKPKLVEGFDTYYMQATTDSGVKSIDLVPTYRGISNTQSTDYLDYVWDKAEQYRDAELQQIRTAIIAMGGSM